MQLSGHEIHERKQFRLLGRRILAAPDDFGLHRKRVASALRLGGAEPLQGALADMMFGCGPQSLWVQVTLATPAVRDRLAPLTLGSFRSAGREDAFPRVSPLASRWSVLTTPSLDAPRRALRSGADDSRALAAEAVRSVLKGDAQSESEFLDHCAGAYDTLAFMLARRELAVRGHRVGSRWDDVAEALAASVS